uniref:Uncharacterized protein n=1 Tax=Oryza brachyantha TaxID=4533 RepID=J3LG02_ORYBR
MPSTQTPAEMLNPPKVQPGPKAQVGAPNCSNIESNLRGSFLTSAETLQTRGAPKRGPGVQIGGGPTAHLKHPAGVEQRRGLTAANGPRQGAPSEGISGKGPGGRRRRSTPASGAGGGAAARSRGV